MGEFILNAPPVYNALADSKKFATKGFIGGKFYQETWGHYNNNRSAGSRPKPSVVRLIPGFPRSGYSASKVLAGEAAHKTGLKTYTHSSTDGNYQIAVKRLLEMLSDGVDPKYRGLFADKNITNLGGAIGMTDKYPKISFLFDADSSITEAVESSTRDSYLKTLLNFGSDLSQEVNYLTKSREDGAADFYGSVYNKSEVLQKGIDSFFNAMGGEGKLDKSKVQEFFNSNPVIEDIANAAIMGYKIFLPKLWSETNFVKKYNINLTLTSPYGDMRSIVKNVYVPFAYLIAMCLPRQASANSMDAPFIISAHSPGNFSVPMGLISNFSIKKGGKNNLWSSKEGISRQITIQMEVSDLYDVLPLPYGKGSGKLDGSNVYGKYDENLRAFLGEGIIGADFSNIRISETGMINPADKSIKAYELARTANTISNLSTTDGLNSLTNGLGSITKGDFTNTSNLKGDFADLVDSAKSFFGQG